MAYLGQFYRTYALDFWGFGESRKQLENYSVQVFVSMVNQFMEQLGIAQAPLVGHSMGGTVGLSVAIIHPDRVRKVAVIGSPIVGSSLSILLKLFGYRPIAWLVYNNLWVFQLFYHALARFYTRDKRWPAMMDRDLSRVSLESFLLSIASLRNTDLRPLIPRINVPAMGMYGNKDIVVNSNQWKPMQAGIPHVRIELFPSAGHFIMLDEPKRFIETLQDFLDNEKPTQ